MLDAGLRVDIRVAWGDMDAYGHVNNTVFLRWFETARIEWFDSVQFPEDHGKKGPVVRAATVDYRLSVKFPDMIAVRVWPTKLGTTSVTLAYEATSAAQKAVVATGSTVVVLVDYLAGASLPLPEDARARIQARLGEALAD